MQNGLLSLPRPQPMVEHGQLAALEAREKLRESIGQCARLRDPVLVHQIDVPLHAIDSVGRVEVDAAIGLDILDAIGLEVQPDLLPEAPVVAAAEAVPVMV